MSSWIIFITSTDILLNGFWNVQFNSFRQANLQSGRGLFSLSGVTPWNFSVKYLKLVHNLNLFFSILEIGHFYAAFMFGSWSSFCFLPISATVLFFFFYQDMFITMCIYSPIVYNYLPYLSYVCFKGTRCRGEFSFISTLQIWVYRTQWQSIFLYFNYIWYEVIVDACSNYN